MMLTIQTRTLNLSGSHYEIGYQLGKMVADNEHLKAKYVVKTTVDRKQMKETNDLLDQWCPGLTEELQGFAMALGVRLESLFFYNMTCYVPHCSHIALFHIRLMKINPYLHVTMNSLMN